MVREREQLSSSSNTIVINFVLPAGEAISQPPLSALLGQVQINSSEFCKIFNTQSLTKYNSGVLLNVLVFKHPDNKFTINIKGLFLPFIFFQASNLSRRKIYLETLYDSFKLYCLDKHITMNTSAARNFLGTLRCSGFKIRMLQTRKKFMSLHISYNVIVFKKKHSFINSQIPIFANKYKFFSFFFSSLPALRSKAILFSDFSFPQIQKPNSSRTALFYFTNFFSALQFFKLLSKTLKLSSEYLPSKHSRSTSVFLTPYPILELNDTVSEFFVFPIKKSFPIYNSILLPLFSFRILFMSKRLLLFFLSKSFI